MCLDSLHYSHYLSTVRSLTMTNFIKYTPFRPIQVHIESNTACSTPTSLLPNSDIDKTKTIEYHMVMKKENYGVQKQTAIESVNYKV